MTAELQCQLTTFATRVSRWRVVLSPPRRRAGPSTFWVDTPSMPLKSKSDIILPYRRARKDPGRWISIFGLLQGIVQNGPGSSCDMRRIQDAHEAQRGAVMDIVICRSPRPDRRGGTDVKPLAPSKTRAKVYNKVVLPSTKPTFINVHAVILGVLSELYSINIQPLDAVPNNRRFGWYAAVRYQNDAE